MIDIMKIVKEQFSEDYNCKIEDFNNRENIVTDYKKIEGRRVYSDEKEILKILIFNGKAIICADECIKKWCVDNLVNISANWMFLYSVLRRIDAKLNEFGYEIDNTHHYYLPNQNDNNEDISNDIDFRNIKWYEKDEIKQFENDDRFYEAFAFDSNYPDVLAVSLLDNDGHIVGMAGASADSERMWQIGINVMPGEGGKGIAKKLVTILKNEILKRGKVAFYGTVESHIISQKVALAAGFYPAFAEIKVRKK